MDSNCSSPPVPNLRPSNSTRVERHYDQMTPPRKEPELPYRARQVEQRAEFVETQREEPVAHVVNNQVTKFVSIVLQILQFLKDYLFIKNFFVKL